MSKRYKYCLVPECRSTTTRCPEKHFFDVPRISAIRLMWCRAMGRCKEKSEEMSTLCPHHVCQDHFDLEEDTINLVRHRLQNTTLNLKPGILPHKFECQKRSNLTEMPEPKNKAEKKSNPKKTSKPEKKSKSPRKKKKPAPSAAVKPSQLNLEPEVVIKEEPIDIDVIKEEPIDIEVHPAGPSTSSTDQEFILPCADSFQSFTTPTVGEAFSVVKTEPVEEHQVTTSNGNTTKSRKRKTSKNADVAEQYAEEDSAITENKSHLDAYGAFIAGELKMLDSKSCAHVQRAIAELLFDAKLGKFK